MKFRSSKGFTLIELMIIVVILGIFAALAIPRFMNSAAKAKQTEAKQMLKQIYVMQTTHRQEYDSYCLNGVTANSDNPNTFDQIGVKIDTVARYTYVMTASADTFTCTATANLDDDKTQDIWIIDQNGKVACISDDATM